MIMKSQTAGGENYPVTGQMSLSSSGSRPCRGGEAAQEALNGEMAPSAPCLASGLWRIGGRVGVEAGETVPGQVDHVGGDLFESRLAGVQPPLAGERHHADEHLGVHRG